jgi:transposase-like protein
MIDKEKIKQLYKDGKVRKTEDLQEILKELTADFLDVIYEAELDEHLGYPKNMPGGSQNTGNSRNGKGSKTVKSKFGPMTVHPPRDRNSNFSPDIIKKRQNDITGIEEKVLSLYGRGLSYQSISDHIEEIYGYKLSKESLSNITDRVFELARTWQNRSLDPYYPLVFLDGMVIKVKKDGHVQKQTVYYVIGYTVNGYKECLGMYQDASESASYWLNVLNELKNRGLEHINIISTDGLAGMERAIEAIYPKTDTQLCVVHQVRNSLKHVPWKDMKAVANDLKTIYNASTKDEGEHMLDCFCDIWDKKYPYIGKSWKKNWDRLSTFYKYSEPLRQIVYTTNPIESFNRQVRSVFKTKGALPSEEAALKLGYLVIQNIQKKWGTMRVRNWGEIIAQLMIFTEQQVGNLNYFD